MSTVITPFQGTDPFSTATFNNRISQINTGFSYISNPNLLDNWYFGNPVNQRGQTEHTGTQNGYFIDRWQLGAYDQTVTITNSGLHWSTTTGIWCTQILENFDELIGRTLTLSAIIDGVLYSVTGVLNESSGISAQTVGSLKLELSHDEKGFRFVTYNNPTPTVTILAAKLELGSQQTLAHQDENGNWVLNEIPDYGGQLARCQRYFVNFNPYKMPWFAMPPAVASNTYDAYSTVTLPVAMRAQPVVAYGGNIMLSQEANHAVTSISVSDNTFTGNSIQLKYEEETGSLTANSLYRVQGGYDASAYIWLSADL